MAKKQQQQAASPKIVADTIRRIITASGFNGIRPLWATYPFLTARRADGREVKISPVTYLGSKFSADGLSLLNSAIEAGELARCKSGLIMDRQAYDTFRASKQPSRPAKQAAVIDTSRF
jgi:hypothetical protein